MATQFAEVETLVGIPPGEAGSALGLADSVEDGLPVGAVDRIAKAFAPDDAGFKFRIVPKSTLERRRKARQRLTIEEGDRVARLAKVYAMAMSIYHDEAKAREFLKRPHMMLSGKAPRDVALATGSGADAVVQLLGRAAYGGSV
jgi:putative toxin-antitoxin system antitoxin component (TIGR02293 family)